MQPSPSPSREIPPHLDPVDPYECKAARYRREQEKSRHERRRTTRKRDTGRITR